MGTESKASWDVEESLHWLAFSIGNHIRDSTPPGEDELANWWYHVFRMHVAIHSQLSRAEVLIDKPSSNLTKADLRDLTMMICETSDPTWIPQKDAVSP